MCPIWLKHLDLNQPDAGLILLGAMAANLQGMCPQILQVLPVRLEL